MAIVNTHYGFCAKGGVLGKFTYTGEYNIRDDGVVELLTSGTIVFLEPMVIDVFCVGGGGRGGEVRISTTMAPGSGEGYGGGGGGLTSTAKNVNVQGSINVTIGAGSQEVSTSTEEFRGETTSFGNILSALGGLSGYVNRGATEGVSTKRSTEGRAGGSGGGGGVTDNSDWGVGGSNGGNGENGYYGSYTPKGGAGQGNTTREFGEAGGKLYGGGGGGGRYLYGTTPVVSSGGSGGGGSGAWSSSRYNPYQAAAAGGANTGGGGGGGVYYAKTSSEAVPFSWLAGGAGGSGIVCFREAQELPELAGTWVLNKRLYPSTTGAAISEVISYQGATPQGNFTGYKINIGYEPTSTVGFFLNASTFYSVYQFSNNTWTDSSRAVQTITFPAGATASDEFRACLASNATKQS